MPSTEKAPKGQLYQHGIYDSTWCLGWVFWFGGFFLATTTACGSFQARDQILATAVAQATAAVRPAP